MKLWNIVLSKCVPTCSPDWVLPRLLSAGAQGRPSPSWRSLAHHSTRPPAATQCFRLSKQKPQSNKNTGFGLNKQTKSTIICCVPVCLRCCLWRWRCTASVSGPATSSWWRYMASSQNKANGSSFWGRQKNKWRLKSERLSNKVTSRGWGGALLLWPVSNNRFHRWSSGHWVQITVIFYLLVAGVLDKFRFLLIVVSSFLALSVRHCRPVNFISIVA